MKTIFLITIMLSLSYFLQAQKKGTISVGKTTVSIRLAGHHANKYGEVYYRNPKSKKLVLSNKRYTLIQYSLEWIAEGKFFYGKKLVDDFLPIGFYGDKNDRIMGLSRVYVTEIIVLDTFTNEEVPIGALIIVY